MKQLTMIIGMAVTVIMVTMSIISIQSKSMRSEELERAVASATKQAVRASKIEEQHEIENNDDMISMFTQLLFATMQSKNNIKIEVIYADYTEGILDVRVTEQFKYLNGKDSTVAVRKTAIWE